MVVVRPAGERAELVQRYLNTIGRIVEMPLSDRRDRTGSGRGRFVSLSLENSLGANVPALRCGDRAVLHLAIDNHKTEDLRNCRISVGINNELEQRFALLDTLLVNVDNLSLAPGA